MLSYFSMDPFTTAASASGVFSVGPSMVWASRSSVSCLPDYDHDGDISLVDKAPVPGVQYYRLAIYEQAGEKSFLPMVVIRIDDPKKATASSRCRPMLPSKHALPPDATSRYSWWMQVAAFAPASPLVSPQKDFHLPARI